MNEDFHSNFARKLIHSKIFASYGVIYLIPTTIKKKIWLLAGIKADFRSYNSTK